MKGAGAAAILIAVAIVLWWLVLRPRYAAWPSVFTGPGASPPPPPPAFGREPVGSPGGKGPGFGEQAFGLAYQVGVEGFCTAKGGSPQLCSSVGQVAGETGKLIGKAHDKGVAAVVSGGRKLVNGIKGLF